MTTATRKAVVFGAAKPGIGVACAERLVKEGYEVIGVATAPDAAEGWPDGLAGQHIMDYGDRPSLLQWLKQGNMRGASAIVFADFAFAMEDPDDFDHETWEHGILVNLVLPNVVFRESWREVADGASYVFVTSTEGFMGSFGASSYSASRAATHNAVKSYSNLAGPRGIRCNAVAAGWIGGVMDTDEVFNLSRNITPLGRLGSATEVAAVAAFLCSEDASFVSGSTVVVDGGYSGVDTIAKYEYEDYLKSRNGQSGG